MKSCFVCSICLLVLLNSGVDVLSDEPSKVILPEDRDWQAYAMEAISTLEQCQRCSEAIDSLRPRMDELLDDLYEMMDDESDALLKQNQDDWQRYNRSRASLIGDTYRGGSLSRVVSALSHVSEHQRRIVELKAAIEDRRPR